MENINNNQTVKLEKAMRLWGKKPLAEDLGVSVNTLKTLIGNGVFKTVPVNGGEKVVVERWVAVVPKNQWSEIKDIDEKTAEVKKAKKKYENRKTK